MSILGFQQMNPFLRVSQAIIITGSEALMTS